MDKTVKTTVTYRRKGDLFGMLKKLAHLTPVAKDAMRREQHVLAARSNLDAAGQTGGIRLFGKQVFVKPAEDRQARQRRGLLRELDKTLAELRYARNCFEDASDPEIIEACVYEIKSAEARYSFLLRKAKETGLTRPHYARSMQEE